jgi:hypothetical protein
MSIYEDLLLKAEYEICVIENLKNPEASAICECKIYNRGCVSIGNFLGGIFGWLGI